jgi:FkbM family methyltransferase
MMSFILWRFLVGCGVSISPRVPTGKIRLMAIHPVHLAGLPSFRLHTHERRDMYISRQIEREGVWEPFESSIVMQCLKPADVFIDLGANIGYYTVLASLACGTNGQVFAFEPEPENFRLLEMNVALNALENVKLVNSAVSDTTGFADLFLSSENQGDHRLYDNEARASRVKVRTLALDDWFRDRDTRVNLVKMDTQGSEAQIIRGMSRIIEANQHQIHMIVEFWPFGLRGAGNSAFALAKALQRFDFTVAKIDEETCRVIPTTWPQLLADAEGIYSPDMQRFTNLLLSPRQ